MVSRMIPPPPPVEPGKEKPRAAWGKIGSSVPLIGLAGFGGVEYPFEHALQ
jgi:hypothetical protein